MPPRYPKKSRSIGIGINIMEERNSTPGRCHAYTSRDAGSGIYAQAGVAVYRAGNASTAIGIVKSLYQKGVILRTGHLMYAMVVKSTGMACAGKPNTSTVQNKRKRNTGVC